MRIAIIGCMVMNREISRLEADSRHVVRVWWQRQGLHDTPDILRAELQRNIDAIEREMSSCVPTSGLKQLFWLMACAPMVSLACAAEACR